MPFGNISTFYLPVAANAGASQWGTDVRKLLSAADATADATSLTDHSTGAAVVRTVDPYTTSVADSVQADFGWAITPADMGSVAGAKRFMRAGNHVATIQMGHNGATGETGTMFCYVYRVGPAAGRTRSLLGSSSNTFVLPVASGEVTATVTVALPEIIFEADETIQYSFEISCAGIVLTGRVLKFYTGTQTVACRLDTPTLRVLADTTGTATGLGTAVGEISRVLGTVGSATGLGTGTAVGAATSETTGTATGVGTATGAITGIGSMTGTATGVGTATATATAVGSATGTATGSGVATGVMGATGGMTGTATGLGDATGSLGATGGMTGTATGLGTATGQGSSVAGTTGTATGLGIATATGAATGSMTGSAAGAGVATGVLGATGGMTGTATGLGEATGLLGATGGMTGTASGLGEAAGLTSSLSGTTGTATGLGVATGVGGAVVGTTGTVDIGGTPDWPLNAPTKTISGVTRNSAGAVVVSAIVKLVRQSDDVRVAQTTSHATTGAYSFTRGGDDPNTYYVLSYKSDIPEIHGVTDRGLVPV